MKRLLLLFLTIGLSASASDLKFIPDLNLRIALTQQGFTTNDSLDLEKIQGCNQLNLVNKNISHTYGLQYFEQVTSLNIRNNNLTELAHLPPNLKFLMVSHNKLTEIEYFQPTLLYLNCSHNEIISMAKTPDNLEGLNFYNNRMNTLPKLQASLQFINYANNPITYLPSEYYWAECKYEYQNCLPLELVDLNLLYTSGNLVSHEIDSVSVKLFSQHSRESSTRTEVTHFFKQNTSASSHETQIVIGKPRYNDTLLVRSEIFSFETESLNQLINYWLSEPDVVKVRHRDSIFEFDLRNIMNTAEKLSACDDCTFHRLEFYVKDCADNLELKYHFDSRILNGLKLSPKSEPNSVKQIMEWLFTYELVNLIMPESELATRYFNEQNLAYLINWYQN